MAGGAERLTAERVSGGAVLAGQGRDTTFGVLAAQEGHNANAMQCSSQASHLARGHEGRKKEGRCQRDRALDEGSARGCSSDGCTTTTHSLARSRGRGGVFCWQKSPRVDQQWLQACGRYDNSGHCLPAKISGRGRRDCCSERRHDSAHLKQHSSVSSHPSSVIVQSTQTTSTKQRLLHPVLSIARCIATIFRLVGDLIRPV